MADCKLLLGGFGNVGRSLVELIASKSDLLEKKYGVYLKVTGITDSSGGVLDAHGFSPLELLWFTDSPRSNLGYIDNRSISGLTIDEALRLSEPDVYVEMGPSLYVEKDPCYYRIRYALGEDVHVVSSCKSAFAIHYNELLSLGASKGLRIRYTSTVMGGTPLLSLIEHLGGAEIVYIRGVLNSTVNYILSLMEEKLVGWREALDTAVSLGITEGEADTDLSGLDAAAKLAIISNMIGKPVSIWSIYRDDVRRIAKEDMAGALVEGKTIRQIASLNPVGPQADVRLEKVPRDSIYSETRGVYNTVEILTEDNNRIIVRGKGAGGRATALSVLGDILSVCREVRI